MSEQNISDVLLDYLLLGTGGTRFEHVVKKMLSIRDGEEFVELGGMHDGGADGLWRDVSELKKRAQHFLQVSIQTTVEAKIRKTVESLRKAKRDVQILTYWSSLRLPKLDTIEDSLSKELGIVLRIKDYSALSRLINDSDATREAFRTTYKTEIIELSAHSEKISNIQPAFATDPSVFVFLDFEVKERFGRGGLVAPIVDSLIYWSLRNTDPDKNILLSRADIKQHIRDLLPGADGNLGPSVDPRLNELSKKDGGGKQRLRFYSTSDSFSLPYEMRMELAQSSATEFALHTQVRQSLQDRAQRCGAPNPGLVATVCEKVIYSHFNQQGVLLAAFLEHHLESVNISDQIVEEELRQVAGDVPDDKSYSCALSVLREVFYTPTEIEDEFLHRLSRTSLLLFSLKHCPKLIDYFNQLTGHFRLFVGTDILVKALAESFLPQEHRHVTNLLKVAKACGARLVLTAPVLQEIFSHLHATYLEFRNHYAEREPYITTALASQSDRIIIRTYFYARLLLKQTTGWKAFINRFLDADELSAKSPKGRDQLQGYLCKIFDMEFMGDDETKQGVDARKLDALTAELQRRYRGEKHPELAKNDALMVLSVYAQRTAHHEVAKYDGFGLRTWWLTKEMHVLSYTGQLVKDNGGVPYIMRPEFLLNFLTLAPTAKESDATVRELLPSHVGLQIGEHLPAAHMHRILQSFDDWQDLPSARAEIIISEAVDQLKHDRFKQWQNNLRPSAEKDANSLIAALKAGRASE
jgi:hypothetical protein